MKTIIYAIVLVLIIASSSVSVAQPRHYEEDLSEGDVLADLLLARPLGAVGSALGLALHGVGLIFSVPGENFGDAGEVLVEAPLNYTFNRPLGRFDEIE